MTRSPKDKPTTTSHHVPVVTRDRSTDTGIFKSTRGRNVPARPTFESMTWNSAEKVSQITDANTSSGALILQGQARPLILANNSDNLYSAILNLQMKNLGPLPRDNFRVERDPSLRLRMAEWEGM